MKDIEKMRVDKIYQQRIKSIVEQSKECVKLKVETKEESYDWVIKQLEQIKPFFKKVKE